MKTLDIPPESAVAIILWNSIETLEEKSIIIQIVWILNKLQMYRQQLLVGWLRPVFTGCKAVILSHVALYNSSGRADMSNYEYLHPQVVPVLLISIILRIQLLNAFCLIEKSSGSGLENWD
jgi:hypothetical protein